MDDFDLRLLNDFQRGFPLCERPFLALAQQLGCSEVEVLARLRALQIRGTVSRVGAVLRPGTVGVSTLAAMAVPAVRLARVAATVSAFPEVNHNYEREHLFNLWFVVTAANGAHLDRALQALSTAARLPVMSLPLLREYRIDLGFDLSSNDTTPRFDAPLESAPPLQAPLPSELVLIAALQRGLALVPAPYAELARVLGVSQTTVLEQLGGLIEKGVIKRFGVVVRHRDLGFVANAMVVFDVPDDVVDRVGASIAQSQLASLCYRRTRHASDWPYNLFCMIHNRSRLGALERLATLRERHELGGYPYAVLFSRACFKQRGAQYLPRPVVAHG